jgi:hypothetical protein
MQLTEALVREAFRRHRDESLSLAERLAGFDYGRDARREARDRAWALVNKLAPLPPSAHGFYDPAGFFDRLAVSSRRKQLLERAQERFLAVIIRRDGLLPEDSYARPAYSYVPMGGAA